MRGLVHALPNIKYLIFGSNFQDLYGGVTECMVSSYEDMRVQSVKIEYQLNHKQNYNYWSDLKRSNRNKFNYCSLSVP